MTEVKEPLIIGEITEEIRERREAVFLYLAGFFLCAMTMLNIIGIIEW